MGLADSEKEKILAAIVVKQIPPTLTVLLSNKTKIPVYKIPAYAFLYFLGNAEGRGYQGKFNIWQAFYIFPLSCLLCPALLRLYPLFDMFWKDPK